MSTILPLVLGLHEIILLIAMAALGLAQLVA